MVDVLLLFFVFDFEVGEARVSMTHAEGAATEKF